MPVSAGELIDKLTILEIKSKRINDANKLANINKELDLLRKTWDQHGSARQDIEAHKNDLKQINEILWQIEDEIRLLERDKNFGDRFIELARAVYQTNDRRAALKKAINEMLGSELTEEKSYADYQDQAPKGE